ncbi:MAG: type II toxin-antitoxin system HipA family toxin [Thermodesulfobacteriota bacterium]|nr:type II toxin-antitoxin system HipA family toxin [Thermodesulfobacteriota bacterium]
MDSTAYVKLWGEIVGAVSWMSDRGYAAFEYEPSFLTQNLDISPIHLGLTKARSGHTFTFPGIDRETFKGLPGLLASSLPDYFGNSVIDAWLVRKGRDPSSFNPVERLCYIGTRGMGALEYSPVKAPANLKDSVSIEVAKLIELAHDVLTERKNLDVHVDGGDREKAAAMLDILRVGVSAGGMVPKAVVAINSANHVLSGQAEVPEGYDHWIIKFDGISEDAQRNFRKPVDNCKIEYAYSLMAKAGGIDMTDCRLLEENGRSHFMTRRFDREHNEKIHVLSLAGIGHFGWNPIGTVGYESAFQIMRILKLPYQEQEQQFRRMVFNAISRNVDDHVKNISYTMDKSGKWKLSPAYDITFSVNPLDALGETHKMTINGRQDEFVFDDFINVAHTMEIKKAEEIVGEILDVVSRWPEFAKEANVSPEAINYVGNLHLDEQSLAEGLSMR